MARFMEQQYEESTNSSDSIDSGFLCIAVSLQTKFRRNRLQRNKFFVAGTMSGKDIRGYLVI